MTSQKHAIKAGINYGADDLITDNSLTNSEKQQILQNNLISESERLNNELRKDIAKQYLGAALQIGSAAIPIGVGARLGVGIVKALAPRVGRKIAQEIGTGLTSGTVSGAIEGIGRGFIEDKNQLQTMVQDSLIGGATGGFGGYGLGRVGQFSVGRKLKFHKNFDRMTSTERKIYNKIGKKYYKDYLQGTTFHKNNYGNIYFNSGSAGKNSIWGVENMPDIKYQLNKAKVGRPTNNKGELDRYYDHLLFSDNNKHIDHEIEVLNNGKKNYKMTKKVEPTHMPGTTPGRSQTLPSYIIPQNTENLNFPSEFMKKILEADTKWRGL